MQKKRISLTDLQTLKKNFHDKDLNTVCQTAKCPNIGECFKNKTATFIILGNICSRNCAFCATNHGIPQNIDSNEPVKIAQSIKELNLKYAVITSVTRDDLKDGGAKHFKKTVTEIKNLIPDIKVEILIPDFQGSYEAIDTVLTAKPDVLSHNIETVPSLYRFRNKAVYKRSLDILTYAKNKNFITKTGIMTGLGESENELLQTFKDVKNTGCNILTIGQYLQPAKNNIPVQKYYTDREFGDLKQKASDTGIEVCISGRYVRSSYFAENAYNSIAIR